MNQVRPIQFLFFIGFISALLNPQEVNSQVRVWSLCSGGNHHFYEYVSTGETFDNARTAATNKTYLGAPGHLVTIGSQEEQDFLTNTFTIGGTGFGPWIGLEDPQGDNTFQWVTGEALNYTNWAAGEPSSTNEQCGHWFFPNDSKWNDATCSSTRGYIIEYEVQAGIFTDNQCNQSVYMFVNESRSWNSAKSAAESFYCGNTTGHLVTITSAEENDFIRNTFNFPSSKSVWIGLEDPQGDNTFEWITGEQLGYVNWGGVEPNNNSEQCAEWGTSGGNTNKWNDAFCSIAQAYLVEFDISKTHHWSRLSGGNGHTYQFVDGAISWYDAEEAASEMSCDGISGHLATLTSAEESNFLRQAVNLSPSTGGPIIGLHDPQGDGSFEWVTGEKLSYSTWDPGEPNNPGIENCVHWAQYNDGDWNDIDCNYSFSGYFVEFDDPLNDRASGLRFDGVDDYLSFDDAAVFDLNGDFTIEAWIYLPSSAPTSEKNLLDKSITDADVNYRFLLRDRKLSFYNGSGTAWSTNEMNTDAWNKIAVVYKAATTEMTFYLNGVENGLSNISLGFPNSADLFVGHDRIGRYANYTLDEFRLWNKDLTSNEIAANLDCPVNYPQDSLVLYIPFDQGEVDDINYGMNYAADFAGLGLDGDLNNFSLTGSTSNWTEGYPHNCGLVSKEEKAVERPPLVLFPNPSTGKLTLRHESDDELHFAIYNIQGQLVKEDVSKKQNIEINLESNPPGNYMMKVQIGAEMHYRKLTIY